MTLSNLLNSVFGAYPDGYSEQYTFKNLSGETIRPDAVVFLPEPNHLICIDSKFPFSNYETLLDGTAKGGVVIGISDQFRIPVKYIGLGEGMEDLQVFRKREFVNSLFGE